MNKRAWHNLTQTERTITIRGYIPWSPDVSLHIWKGCRQQAAAHNRAIAELLERPKTPLRKSAKRGAIGLQGLWVHWRKADAKARATGWSAPQGPTSPAASADTETGRTAKPKRCSGVGSVSMKPTPTSTQPKSYGC